jgi:hypothetical protein
MPTAWTITISPIESGYDIDVSAENADSFKVADQLSDLLDAYLSSLLNGK